MNLEKSITNGNGKGRLLFPVKVIAKAKEVILLCFGVVKERRASASSERKSIKIAGCSAFAQCNLFCCSTDIMSPNPSFSLNSLLGT